MTISCRVYRFGLLRALLGTFRWAHYTAFAQINGHWTDVILP